MPPAKKGKPAPADLPRTIAHHLEQAGTNQAHAVRHIAAAQQAKGKAATAFNLDHAAHHAKEAQGKIEKATATVAKKVPAVGAELKKLQDAKPVQVPAKPPARKPTTRKR